jgi:predicted MFS family arabinose efflux permease
VLSLLRQRNFALLWFGGLVSVGGDWVLYAALPYFVFQRTGSTLATAGMIVAELAPGVVVGSFAGVVVDRLDRRRLLVAANLVQAATVISLLLAVHGSHLWVVYVAAAIQSVAASFAQPAESALLPSLVAPDLLLAANAMTTLNNRFARLAGVPLGGLLLGLGGLTPVVLTDAVSFLVAAAMIAAVVGPPRVATVRTRLHAEWLDGLRLIRGDRTIAGFTVVLALMTFAGTMIDPLYVAWVRDVLGRGPTVYGLLLTTHSVSGIVGTLLVGYNARRLAPRVLMGWSSIVAGLVLVAKWDIALLPITFAFTLIGGLVSAASAIGIETYLQAAVADAYRGRVFAALGASGSLASLLGATLGGIGAKVIGITAMLNVAALLVAVSGAVVLRTITGAPRGKPLGAGAPL